MEILTDEKKSISELNCLKIELNSKPLLLRKVVDSSGTLVLTVDAVDGFCRAGAMYSARLGEIIKPIQKFLQTVPQAKKAFIRDCHGEAAAEFKWFPPHCADPRECALVEELRGFEGIDIPKNSTNGFFNLIKRIPDLGFYSNVAVLGVCTDICVMQLALSIRAYFNESNLGGNVLVFTDLVETYDGPLHNADLYNTFALKIMEQAGVQLFKNIM
jgi:nicotinamidase-related amidase